ncbi:MAG: TlyA family rRNA (cytidine-2'-O)-methyltransferase [Phototrophicales bacterium]|nr:MAG: TlyA family rRNA (cytidine-2'-O)-methyltransferase [Phototrophicales bacterium]
MFCLKGSIAVAKNKKRLDVLVYERGLAPSREMAQRYISAGEVFVNGQIHTKVGTRFATDVELSLKASAQFVSRGGLKLQSALDAFAISVENKICADVGASTGGFTDCLLQAGAAKVYALDVGYGQLALKIRQDPRVVVMERVNVRYLENLDEPIELVVIDVSFISLSLVLPVVAKWLVPNGEVIPLIKPQFEAGKSDVGKGGIVKDHEVHRRVLQNVLENAQSLGFGVHGLIPSGITGAKGNIEFLAWLKFNTKGQALASLIDAVISQLERS